MALIRELQRAKFRDIEFYWVSSNLSGGRKTVTHEYPNSDRRYVEDLGKLQKTFNVNAVISGNRYLQQRNALIETLEKEGDGILQHPLYGQQRVYLKSYTINESENKLGEAEVNFVFERVEDNIFPTETSNNTSLIAKATQNIIDAIQSEFEAVYSLSEGVLSYIDSKTKVSNILDTFEEVSTGIDTVIDQTNDISAQILDFRQNINTVITSPQELAASITGLFNALDGIARNPFAQIDLLAGFFNFGSEDSTIVLNTPQRQQKQDNRDLLNNFILVDSLTLANEAVLSLEFSDTTQIDNIRETINTQNEKVIARESLPEQLLDDLISQNKEINKYLDQQELITPRVREVDVKSQPLLTLAYNYDGNTDKFETLVSLNNNPDINFVEGTIKVLTK